jgi:formylglycine-generating enzyme required for sulfatase activity/HEAT repeat protein
MASLRSIFAALTAISLTSGVAAPSLLAQPSPEPAQSTPSPTLVERGDEFLEKHQASIAVAVLLLVVYLGVLGIRPLWLLKLPSSDIPINAFGSNLKIPLGFVRLLKYRSRVLDTWVNQHWQQIQAEFLNLPTVDNRAIHIALPVRLGKTPLNDLGSKDLAPTFKKKPAVLLISGEGGAGKTSLACQIAQWGLTKQLSHHRMVPVLMENELDDQLTLFEAIRGQLTALSNLPEPINPELLEKLLQRQRVLVIVDHLSEMGPDTRKQIKPRLPEFPAKALVITSRLEENGILKEVPTTVLQPLQVEANRLWPFMSAYLEAKGQHDLFEDDEYSNGCDRLRRMAGERSITVLLARLYIDHMIQERQGAGGILPDSVPKLMLSYLNQLNQSIEKANKRDDLAVQQDAKAIAWKCLDQTYRPTSIKEQAALDALTEADDSDSAKDRLTYLEQRLQFVTRSQPLTDVRIILDPLAEYLAATALVEHYCQQDDPAAAWDEFFASVRATLEKTNETPDIIRGFLLALRDCCLDNLHEDGIPVDLPDQLARTANIDPDELRRAQEKRRIRRMIFDLSEPELKDRLRAVEELAQGGPAARIAEPNLVGMLENRNQTPIARQAAAQALGKLAIAEGALLDLVANPEEDLAVRRSAAEALGEMKAGRETLLSILEDETQPLDLRQGAARAIGLIGAPSGEAVPMLMVELQAGQVKTQMKSIRVWKEPLTEDLAIDLVEIPGGEFLMGSPPDEVGRDVYFPTYPDTEGLDVEAQHRVTVQPFCMGQHPITQAQWRVVAALPAVNRELEPNPANFKGDQRPVEQVTWYDAVEFCDRLSQYTGKTYRLPSEAEWEYACRAGTTSPFYLGDTLSTDLANYDGNYTYGPGKKGIYREQTVEVGSFGVNGWGLADMHGNVYDWCLDHWHPSYERAPSDGSAWVTDGNDNYRLVRGGSWYGSPVVCRSAVRSRYTPRSRHNNVGLRVVCVSPWTL